ncbi:alpha/beta hydrolase [Sciscionella marina]|uniref:alpha/beta hydrolase n=1 Tax=Sciscionella marina TaxID=508770 RepID=UPI00036A2C19|nr:alpha/beta hydrolase [Sciscionella marina]
MSAPPRPVPYDPQLLAGLAAFRELVEPFPLRADTILASRAHFAKVMPSLDAAIEGLPVRAEQHRAPGPPGAPEVALTVLRPRDPVHGAPGILGIHGGGLVLGDRFFGAGELAARVVQFGAVAVSVEYRLAPEHPAPAAAEDCYAALVWFARHAAEFGVAPERILVSGASAGGGLAAAVVLMARDRGGPALAGQLLDCPMLDDRNETVSSRQFAGIGVWDRYANAAAWTAALGARRGTESVPAYAAPARAAELAGLPPAFLTVGSAEVFRDETVRYASRIWAAGGRAELHVWSGGYHEFAGTTPEAEVSRSAVAARDSWLHRVFAR